MGVLAAMGACAAPCAPPADLHDLLTEVRMRHQVPAIAALLVDGGRIVAEGASGMRRAGRDDPVDCGSIWHLGSCGKLMTAAALARLAAAGTLSLSATMGAVWPGLASGMHAAMRDASVRELLEHRAGLAPCTTTGNAATRRVDARATPSAQRAQIAAAALAMAPTHPRGGQRVYANTGYWIAGAVLELSAGVSFELAMHELVWAPLGMATAGCGQPAAAQPAAPWGQRLVLGRPVPASPVSSAAVLPAWYAPAGDMHASLRDFAKFLSAYCSDASMDSGDVVPAVSVDWAAKPVLLQHGSSTHWHACFVCSPSDLRFGVVACNLGGENGRAACDEVLAALVARWSPAPR